MDQTTDTITTSKPKSAPDRTSSILQSMMELKVSPIVVQLGRIYEFAVEDVDNSPGLRFNPRTSTADRSYVSDAVAQTANRDPSTIARVALSAKHYLDLPAGITIVMGRTGSGKTALTLGRMSANNDSVKYVRFGEPLDDYFTDAQRRKPDNVTLLNFEVQLAAAIGNFMLRDDHTVMVIDSLRYLVYSTAGSTGKGGVNMTMFADLSFLDVAIAQTGRSLVIVLNPMTDDDTAYANLVEVAAGSVSALVDVKSPRDIRVTSRAAKRAWHGITLNSIDYYDDSAVVDVSAARGTSRARSITNIIR